MEIKELPQPPSRSDPESFPERADAFLAALPAFAAQLNALAKGVGADKEATSRGSASAASSERAAVAQASIAQAAKAAAQASADSAAQNASQAQRARSDVQSLKEQGATALAQVQALAQEGNAKWQQILDVARRASGAVKQGTYTKVTVDAKGWVTAGAALSAADVPNLPQSKIEGLDGALKGKASSSHTHGIADVNGLQGALNGKAAVNHSHNWDDVAQRPGVLGDGQRWQTVTRVSGTTYTNTTGKPIMVHVRSTGDASSTSATISIDGVDIYQSGYNGRAASVAAVIPARGIYRVSAYPGMYVCELR